MTERRGSEREREVRDERGKSEDGLKTPRDDINRSYKYYLAQKSSFTYHPL